MVIGAALVCVAMWIKFDRPIDKIVIEGDLTLAEQAAMQKHIGGLELPGILSLVLPRLETQLQQMDWARRVDVRRRWPNQLVIYVYKESPVAQWDDHTFLSADGDILQLPGSIRSVAKIVGTVKFSAGKHGDLSAAAAICGTAGLGDLRISRNGTGRVACGFRIRHGAASRCRGIGGAYAAIFARIQQYHSATAASGSVRGCQVS